MIPGYEGCYAVSDDGRVKSLDRTVEAAPTRRTRAYTKVVKGRILSTRTYPPVARVAVGP
jgi:hypothetical protein